MLPLLFFLALFLLILLSLFLISKTLTQDLGRIIYRITRSQKAVIYILAFLYFPGTLIHELSHYLTAALLGVHVGEVELFPEITEKGIKLGSVQIGKCDVFRRSLIGVAPFVVGISLILALFFVYPPFLILNSSFLIQCLVIYFLFEVSNTMYSSNKDMEGVVAFLVATVLIIALVSVSLFGYFGDSFVIFINNIDYSFVNNVLFKGSQLLLIPLIIDIFALFIIKLLLKIRI